MLSKRGELTTKEILELILGAAVFVLLAVFLYQLISPNFEASDESAEGYFDSFVEAVGVADSGGVGVFSIWLPGGREEDRKFYLVYFGNSSSYGIGLNFYSLGNNLNHVCVCSSENGDTSCDYCKNLRHPISVVGLSEDEKGRWAIGTGEKIEVVLKEGIYEVRKV